jgi:2-phospho-L-lactate guanylyltransferase
MTAHVVIGARGGLSAKTRLAGCLDAAARELLIEAMLSDMLEALVGCPGVASVTLVTPTPTLAALAERQGARSLIQQGAGLNPAFTQGRGAVAAADPEAMLMLLPGDLPLLDRTDVETCLSAAGRGRVVIAPSLQDGGTGGLVVEAGVPLVLAFGRNSCARHAAAADALGLETRLASVPGLAVDVDRPEDLILVRDHPRVSRTSGLLRQWKAAA